MSMLEKKRKDRVASKKRLMGDNYRSDEDPLNLTARNIKPHECKGPPDGNRIRAHDDDPNDKI